MSEIKEKILKKLGTIKYPGYNRDIVSFGIVKNIIVTDENVIVLLKLNTDNLEHKKEIKDEIYNMLSHDFKFKDICLFFDPDKLMPSI